MYSWDREFGRVIKYLKDNNLYEDTLIVFTSDNGGYQWALSPTRQLSGAKGSLWEGGIRVPFLVTWPKVVRAGSTSNVVITSMDIYPTVMGLLGEVVSETDGANMEAVLTDSSIPNRKHVPFWQMRTVSWRSAEEESASEQYAIRSECMKLLKTGASGNAFKLFDVCDDPGEHNDLSMVLPVVFEQMKQSLHARRQQVSGYLSKPEISAPLILPDDDRLNIHQDDLTVVATLKPGYESGRIYNIYERGQGIQLTLDTTVAGTSTLVVRISGVGSKAINAVVKKIGSTRNRVDHVR